MEEDSQESIVEDREDFTEVYLGKSQRKKNAKRKKSKEQEDKMQNVKNLRNKRIYSEDMTEPMQDNTKKKDKRKSRNCKRTNCSKC